MGTLPFLEIKFQSFPSNQSRSSARQCVATAGDQRQEIHVTTKQKTIIVTGASQGIGGATAPVTMMPPRRFT
jgi:hypothetical protein